MDDRDEVFANSLIGARVGGRYVVERILGVGGMGVVVAAHHADLEQHVAIKFLRPELSSIPAVAGRFLREARLSAKVQSPNLIKVFDVGKHEEAPYIVMELLSGQTVGEELAQRGPLPAGEAVDLLLQACAGVAELHARGVVHRDLKPVNMFVTKAAGVRTIKVLDFGISKDKASLAKHTPLTASESLLGTPQYMSPEQIKDAAGVDARSDIWALGVIFYELVTGTLPFVPESDSVGEVLGLILFKDPEPPSKRAPNLDPALERVILRCLDRDRDRRFATVGELADAIAPFALDDAKHRVDHVHRALVLSEAPPADASSSKPPSVRQIEVNKTELPETLAERAARGWIESSPRAAELERAPTAVPAVQAKKLAVVTSAPWSTDTGTGAQPRRKALTFVGLALGAALLTGGALVGLRSFTSTASVVPDATGSAAAVVPDASVLGALSAAGPATEAPIWVAPSGSSMAAKAPVAAVGAPKPVHGAPAKPASAPAATSAKPVAPKPTADLLDDRK